LTCKLNWTINDVILCATIKCIFRNRNPMAKINVAFFPLSSEITQYDKQAFVDSKLKNFNIVDWPIGKIKKNPYITLSRKLDCYDF